MYTDTFKEESLSPDTRHGIETGVTAIYEGAERTKHNEQNTFVARAAIYRIRSKMTSKLAATRLKSSATCCRHIVNR